MNTNTEKKKVASKSILMKMIRTFIYWNDADVDAEDENDRDFDNNADSKHAVCCTDCVGVYQQHKTIENYEL